jgi:RimJ/RimL family protein N-acetyltransferase
MRAPARLPMMEHGLAAHRGPGDVPHHRGRLPARPPPDLRGRGFGAAATATITQAALDDGAEGVVLFTDLDNPTSNTLYQRLGYRPVSDWAVLRFAAPERPASAYL